MKRILPLSLLMGLTLGAHASTVTMHVFNFDFGMNPPVHSDPVIEKGDTIHWVFDSGVHSTTAAAGQADTWNSGVKSSGSFDYTHNVVGVFSFFCSLHGADLGGGAVAGMSGKVTVLNAFLPTSLNIVRGQLIGGGLNQVQTSDDQYLTVQKGLTLNPSEPPIQVTFSTTSTVLNPTVLQFAFEDGVNASGLNRRVEALNMQTNQFETVLLGTAPLADTVTVVAPSGTLSRFVNQTNGQVTVKFSYFQNGPVSVPNYQARFDRVAVRAL